LRSLLADGTLGLPKPLSCATGSLLNSSLFERSGCTVKLTPHLLQTDFLIECPQPKAPSGGRVSGFNREIHSKIEYSCFPGHVLEGQSMVTCTSNGLWSSRVPNCRFVDCGRVPELDSGTVHYVNKTTHLGSVVRYSCGRSHSILGLPERTCLPNGKWSGTVPNCSEIRCSLPPKPNNTIVSVSSTERLHGTSVIRSKFSEVNSYRVGATLKYRCERGFILKSTEDKQNLRVMTRRCTTSGGWTGDTPFCTFVDNLLVNHL